MRIRFRHKYDFVCSIGHYCAPAMYMRRHFLRSMSGPLDWIAGSSGGLLASVDLICRDFEGFMQKDRLIRIPNPRTNQDDLEHDYYRDEGTQMVFYHDFPTGMSQEQAYGAVREKYDRRIARFYSTMNGKSLLIFHTKAVSVGAETVKEAARRLRAKFKCAGVVDLLVIETVEGMKEMTFAELEPGVYHAQGWFYRPEIHWVLGDLALCDRIYSAIRCVGRTQRKLTVALRKLSVRIRTMFYINREHRRAARERHQGRGGYAFN